MLYHSAKPWVIWPPVSSCKAENQTQGNEFYPALGTWSWALWSIQPEDNETMQKANESERTGLFDDIIALILSLSIVKELHESGYLICADS